MEHIHGKMTLSLAEQQGQKKQMLGLRQHVGTADAGEGHKYTLSFGMMNGVPIVESEQTGRWWSIPWQELIEMAIAAGIDGDTEPVVRKCRVCGCTEEDACCLGRRGDEHPDAACVWVREDICSNPVCMAWARTHKQGDEPSPDTVHRALLEGQRDPASIAKAAKGRPR